MDRTGGLPPSLHAEESDRGVYLARCQVDTPERLLRFVWTQVNARRPNAGDVVDFGCGDARFSRFGTFDTYTGFEIDPARGPRAPLRSPHKVVLGDAFEPGRVLDFSTCIGNPPYVRHHDLEEVWLGRADKRLKELMPYQADGRSNAYVYFMWLAMASVGADGLVALVIPFEWVSRPASAKLRAFIKEQGWDVDVFHIRNAAFERVLTTACVAVIDKRAALGGKWRFFDVDDADVITPMKEVTGSSHKQLAYQKAAGQTRAIRGLSPGGKEVFVLTEAERIHFQLQYPSDVVPAVSSFRHIEQSQVTLTEALFRKHYVHTGQRCWLLNVEGEISPALKAYLDQVPEEARSNYTCKSRKLWWKFVMPKVADILYSSGFKTARPKMFRNVLGAIHVGGIHGIHCELASDSPAVMAELLKIDLSKKVVSLAKGFLKVEVRQMNTVLNDIQKRLAARA
ncbi:Eco57I restriction-modification methylase domain-containing protein [Paucibacter sp. PLA-PC-4]|uniref:Eco57I restriction-modification methylase domain-containing protein n=1 Tax=Paucibacter sp. PLA-PC-4 TaxID=2993655 RepID=UPI00224B4BCD|nr:Eco57I restriction-modification methylase domain-containing protein [Paucibacter sp. PLA-PC-4]MCX2865373.1 Eco57I restriction-modification methylase domain-containing protein [Paucibacter sp. PLA-PC-4]